MDYQGNAKKDKEQKPEKVVERVVLTEVVVQKRGLGRKIRDLFVEADFRNSAHYVVAEVLIPAARNMIVDATIKGVERMVYGDTAIRRRNFGSGPRVTYNNPINRGYSSGRSAPPVERGPRTSRPIREDFILSSREEADLVIERMADILDTYEVVSVADLNDLMGLPASHTDNKWGWMYLGDVKVRQIREGYLIDFPAPEPI